MSEQADNLPRVEYQQRLQPQREPGGDAFAALLAAFATVLGLAAFWLAPFKTGISGLALAILALCISRGNSNAARWAFYICALGWFVGCTLGVESGPCLPLPGTRRYLFGAVTLNQLLTGVALGVLMHHYFVDQYIWRPSKDAELRRDLKVAGAAAG